jgi:hypothetical protein
VAGALVEVGGTVEGHALIIPRGTGAVKRPACLPGEALAAAGAAQ